LSSRWRFALAITATWRLPVHRPLLRAALLGAAIVCCALAGEGLLVGSGQLVAPPDVASALAHMVQWISLATSLSALFYLWRRTVGDRVRRAAC
jgi:hypothetical protein